MKRIGYLARGGPVGGSQRQFYYLLKNLNHNFSPVVFFDKCGTFSEQVKEQGFIYSVFDLPPWRKFPKGIFRYWHAEALVQQARRYDIALIHCSNLCLSGYMHWIAGRLGIPSVLHVRTPMRAADVYKHRCKKATALIAISRRIRRNLLEAKIAPDKIVRIHDAVDLKAFYPMDHKHNLLRRAYHLNNSVVVGLVGRIESSKKQLKFLQIAETIVKHLSGQVKFWLIGPAHHVDYFGRVKQFIHDRNLQKHVLLMGQRENMPNILNAIDILVTLSGGSIMFEAASCGKPIVAMYSGKNTSRLAKYVTCRPILVTQNQKQLLEKLLWLIKNPTAREKIGNESQKWAERSFDINKMVEKTQKLYEKILS